jgi:hypothetical protein
MMRKVGVRMKQYMNRWAGWGFGIALLTAGGVTAEQIVYTFETPANISGATSEIVYTAPDENTFSSGVTVSDLELSEDGGTSTTDYGRIEDLGGGSVEAAVNDRAGETISFTVTIDSSTTANFTSITFDTSFRSTLASTDVDWTFATVVGGVTQNETLIEWTHDGGDSYQTNGSSDITLSGLTGLRGTDVTFMWTMDGSRNNTYANLAGGIDDIVLTGTAYGKRLSLIAITTH